MEISFSARTDFCVPAANKARVTISPSTEIDSHESSRALITTSKFPCTGTAGVGTGEDDAITFCDDVDPVVVASAGFAEESTGSPGFCAGGEVSSAAVGALVEPAAGEAGTVALFGIRASRTPTPQSQPLRAAAQPQICPREGPNFHALVLAEAPTPAADRVPRSCSLPG